MMEKKLDENTQEKPPAIGWTFPGGRETQTQPDADHSTGWAIDAPVFQDIKNGLWGVDVVKKFADDDAG